MNSVDQLMTMFTAHCAAFGAHAQTPLMRLMETALDCRDENVAAAVLAHVQAAQPKETAALHAVAKELDADKRPPALWLAVDIESVPVPVSGSLSQTMQLGASVVPYWGFRRENPTMSGKTLAARLLFPEAMALPHVEGAAHLLRMSGIGLSMARDRAAHRQALLAAAVDRAATNTNATK